MKNAMKIPQKDSVTLLADRSHDFYEQMKFTAITEAITFALKQNYRSICIYAFLHNTQCFPVSSFWRKLKWRHKACPRTAAAGPSLLKGPDRKCRLWKNGDLSGSPDRGCGLTTDSLYDGEVCPGMTPCSKMQRPGRRGLWSTITPKELLWERMCMQIRLS